MKKSKLKALTCQQCGTETMNFSFIEVQDIYKATAKVALVCRACRKHFKMPERKLGLIPRQFWAEHKPHVNYSDLEESTNFKHSRHYWCV